MTETIAIAADHAGFDLKAQCASWLAAQGFTVEDLGTHSTDSVDYPDYADKLAAWLKAGKGARGVLICGSGIGISIAANRHRHVRAALCTSPEMAELGRKHNDANVLVLGSRIVKPAENLEIVRKFVMTNFENGRHQARVNKLG